MDIREVIAEGLKTSRLVLFRYIDDFSDADLYVRPVPKAHTTAWQLGHLVLSERMMMKGLGCKELVELPERFESAHAGDRGYSYQEDSGFFKEQYRELLIVQRERVFQLLEETTTGAFASAGPIEMRQYAPTVASVFLAMASHEMLHAGQIAVIRRFLEKAVCI
jgi:hypothetical protein